MKAACPRMAAQHVGRRVERRRIEHGAREDHARHARCRRADPQVVDRLRDARAVRRKGMARQRTGVVEADETRLARRLHVDEQAALAQVRIAVLVVRDPARAVRVARGKRRAAVRRVMDQLAAAVPQEDVLGRPADTGRDPVQLRDEIRIRGQRSLPQRGDERMAAPAHGLPRAALLHVFVEHGRASSPRRTPMSNGAPAMTGKGKAACRVKGSNSGGWRPRQMMTAHPPPVDRNTR